MCRPSKLQDKLNTRFGVRLIIYMFYVKYIMWAAKKSIFQRRREMVRVEFELKT